MALIADDEEMVRSIAKVCFERSGFSVLEAADGEEALAVYERHARGLALALVDLTMPKLSGGELYEHVRRTDPDLRIILTSGYGPGGAPEPFSTHEPTRFLGKPFRPQELIDMVEEMMAEQA